MADENRSAGTGAENPENKRVLVHADHVKVYFKGKEKKANAEAGRQASSRRQ